MTSTASISGVDGSAVINALEGALEWRGIGPFRAGRVVAVAGDPSQLMTFYFGACNGGVWKTTDGGTYWVNVSDGYFKTAAVGAIAVSDSDPNVIYVGTGEACIRGDVSHGDGVYKSTDGGQTWANVGLPDSRYISRIRIHPTDPDTVYVAALGHAYGPSSERGVFRSRDGGANWERVLFRHKQTGAADLAMDPTNPRVLYAALWEVLRTPWSLTSGGANSGLFKSVDAGDTWTELTDNPGFPQGLKGRIGVAVSPANPDRVWASVEVEDGAFCRSDDGGKTWRVLTDHIDLRRRPWYYSHVFADTQDQDTVYVLNVNAFKSVDGGTTFNQLITPHDDNHDLWIDPRDPKRMIEGNDGGACVSFNGGAVWSTVYNQPTAQFYQVAVDTQFPYRVYGTQQDNSAISVPSRSFKGGIIGADAYPVGSSESGFICVRPDNPNIVYSGAVGSVPGGGAPMLRYDHASGQVRNITIWPEVISGWGAKDFKYRFRWTYPIILSPHDPNTLYSGGNIVFRSTDEGSTWEPISPDLTRDDEAKMQASGGPITHDTSGAEHYCCLSSLAESKLVRGLLWAGSDDGLVHVSPDDGGSWANVTPKQMPQWATVNNIEPSHHDASVAYLTASSYKLDDNAPYIYRTSDGGKTWTLITDGVGAEDFARVVREDPERAGLLYLGTETGAYVSINDGASWQPVRKNLPTVPVYDLLIKDGALVAATHGRAFWILDNLGPLRQATASILGERAHLFQPAPAYRVLSQPGADRPPPAGLNYRLNTSYAGAFVAVEKADGSMSKTGLDMGKNPADGVVVIYLLQGTPGDECTLEFLDGQGGLIKRFSSAAALEDARYGEERLKVSAVAGVNRFVWNMRYPDAHRVPGDPTTDRLANGPLAPPGRYTVRLSMDGDSWEQPFEVRQDPRTAATQAQLDEQFAFLLKTQAKLSQTNDAINLLRSVRAQVEPWESRLPDLEDQQAGALGSLQDRIKERLDSIEEELIQKRSRAATDVSNYPSRLNYKIGSLQSAVSSADHAPNRQSQEVFDYLSERIDVQLALLDEVIKTNVGEFNRLVQDLGLPAIAP